MTSSRPQQPGRRFRRAKLSIIFFATSAHIEHSQLVNYPNVNRSVIHVDVDIICDIYVNRISHSDTWHNCFLSQENTYYIADGRI